MWTLSASLWEAFFNKGACGFPSHFGAPVYLGLVLLTGRKKNVTVTVIQLNFNFSENPKSQNSSVWIIVSTLPCKKKKKNSLPCLYLTPCVNKSLLGEESSMDAATLIEKFTYGGEKLAAQGNKVRKMQMQALGGTKWPGHSRSIQWSRQGNWLQKRTWTSHLRAEESTSQSSVLDQCRIKTPVLCSKIHKGT